MTDWLDEPEFNTLMEDYRVGPFPGLARENLKAYLRAKFRELEAAVEAIEQELKDRS